MDRYKKSALKNAGIGIDEVYKRFPGSDGLIAKFFLEFAGDYDGNYPKLKKAVLNNDNNTALIAADALKGTCCELYITELGETISKLQVYLKEGDIKAAHGIMQEVIKQYKALSEVIKAVFGQYGQKNAV